MKDLETTVTYKWRHGARISLAPEIAGPEIERLAASGATSAEEVLASAKKKSSPLHPAFRWDDAEAAHNDRLQTARQLLRSIVRCVVRITPHGREETSARVVVGLNSSEPERRYIRPSDMTATELDQLAVQLVAELRSFAARNAEFRGHALLKEVFAAIDKIPVRHA